MSFLVWLLRNLGRRLLIDAWLWRRRGAAAVDPVPDAIADDQHARGGGDAVVLQDVVQFAEKEEKRKMWYLSWGMGKKCARAWTAGQQIDGGGGTNYLIINGSNLLSLFLSMSSQAFWRPISPLELDGDDDGIGTLWRKTSCDRRRRRRRRRRQQLLV